MSSEGSGLDTLLGEVHALRRQVAEGSSACERLAAELEQRVADRTAELLHTNEQLRQEIAQREMAEAALRQANIALERAWSMFISGPVVVFKWQNREGWPVDYVSPNVTDILGYPPEDFFSGRVPYGSIVLEADHQRVAEEVRTHSESGATNFQHLPYRLLRQRGETIWVADYTTILRDEQGVVTHYMGYIINITEARRTEEELRESRRMLWLVMDTIPHGIFWKDTRSVYLGCNRHFAQEAGVGDPRGVVGKTDDELAWKEDAPSFIEGDREVMEGDRAKQEILHRRRRGDGRMAWFDIRKVPLHDQQGKVVGVLGTAADITNRRLLEAQVREAKKLESLGALAGGVAHDFNNFLTVIFGYTALLLKKLPPESGLGRHVLQIERASERGAELVHQMLTYSGQSDSKFEQLELRTLVEEMAQLLRISISKEVELRFHFPEEFLTVDADASRLRQIVMNLIVNANDAMEGAPGVISLTTGMIEADRSYLRGTYLDQALATGSYVFLEISDTGCGMDRETRARLFDPFFTTKPNGRGLGMASVLGIVRAHGGTIKVESQVGEGSTFRILFPRPGRPAEPSPQQPETDAPAVLTSTQDSSSNSSSGSIPRPSASRL